MSTMEELQKQLSDKDELINQLKEKTKQFVSKMKDDQINEMNTLKQQHQDKLEQAKNIMLKMKEENETLKTKAVEDQSLIKNLEAAVEVSKVRSLFNTSFIKVQ
jgi:membrane protein involved in colicin uptake